MKHTTAEIRNSTAKIADTQRIAPSDMLARAIVSTPANVNISPTSTPTVVIDAWSNCRITAAMAIQAIPAMSPSHQ